MLKRRGLLSKGLKSLKSPQNGKRFWSKSAKRRTRIRKIKITKSVLRKADDAFSLQIRTRDGRCMHPRGTDNCKLLQNSHFIGRANKAVRFDPENCDTICWFHHFKSKDLGFEYQKQTIEKHGFDGQYTLWKKQQLGAAKYAALIERSLTSVSLRAALDSFQNNQALTAATQTPIEI